LATAAINLRPCQQAQPAEFRRVVPIHDGAARPDTGGRTRRGFGVLHGGLALLFVLLVASNHWVLAGAPIPWGGAGVPNPLSLLLSTSAFYYWTIFHVTLSFVPKPVRASVREVDTAPIRGRDVGDSPLTSLTRSPPDTTT
jgi:hypothetical protein